MRDAKILDALLDEDFGVSPNGNCIADIVYRYLMIMGAPKDNRPLLSLGNRQDAHVEWSFSYNEPERANSVRLCTKEAPVEQYIKKTLGVEVEVLQYVADKKTIIHSKTPTNASTLSSTKNTMAILAIYPKLVPWLCPLVTDTDKEVITALTSGKLENLITVTNKIVDEKLGDFRTRKMMSYLKTLQSRTHEAEWKQVEHDIEMFNDEINRLQENIRNACENLREAERRLAMLSREEVDDGDDLIRFFRCHKQLTISKQSGDKVYVRCNETVEYYDDKDLGEQLSRPGTFWYNVPADIKKICKFVFVEKKAKLRVTSEFSIDSKMYVYIAPGASGISNDRMPHPHINRYSCLGTNASYLADYNLHGEWDLAIEQIIAATKNINIYDRPVMGYMTDYIRCNMDNEMFEDAETGELVSARSILRMINERSNA